MSTPLSPTLSQRSLVSSNGGLVRQPWPPVGMTPLGTLSNQQQGNKGTSSLNLPPSLPVSSRPLPTIVRGGQVLTMRPMLWRSPSRMLLVNPTLYPRVASHSFMNSSRALKLLNVWMGTQSFIAAIFNGGYKIKGIPNRGKVIKGLYEPSKYSGLWPGIYKPGSPVRKWLIDTPLIASCFWDGGNAFLKYASACASPGAGLAAGMVELLNGLVFSVRYSEPIMYGIMNKTTQFLAKFIKLPPAVDLMEKASPELVKNGIPLSYRLIRTFGAGAMALMGIEAIMLANSSWITPFVAKKLGPQLDTVVNRYAPSVRAKLQQVPVDSRVKSGVVANHATSPAMAFSTAQGLPLKQPVQPSPAAVSAIA